MSSSNQDPFADLKVPEIDREQEKLLTNAPHPESPDPLSPIIDPNTCLERVTVQYDNPAHSRRLFHYDSPEADQLKAAAEAGAQLYAQMSNERSLVENQQIFSLENPDQSATFARDHGITPEIEKTVALHATTEPGTRFIAQPAWTGPEDSTPLPGMEVIKESGPPLTDLSFTVDGSPSTREEFEIARQPSVEPPKDNSAALDTSINTSPTLPFLKTGSVYGDPDQWVAHKGSELEAARLASDSAIGQATYKVLEGASTADSLLDAVDNVAKARDLNDLKENWNSYLDHVAKQTGSSYPMIDVASNNTVTASFDSELNFNIDSASSVKSPNSDIGSSSPELPISVGTTAEQELATPVEVAPSAEVTSAASMELAPIMPPVEPAPITPPPAPMGGPGL